MAVLRFKECFKDLILASEKVQTLRAKVPGGIKVGEEVDAASSYSKPAWAKLLITGITPISLEEVDDEISRADGFEDAAALKENIADLYPGVTSFHAVAFICVEAS